jgi:predicted GIY-YIG superfamily endonuclease
MQIYIFEAENKGLYKIGVSKNAKKRVKQVQTGCPFKLKIKETFDSKYAYKIESNIHRKLRNGKSPIFETEEEFIGEWFELDEEFLSNFKNMCENSHKAFEALDDGNNPFF